jgi:hypothetical protein
MRTNGGDPAAGAPALTEDPYRHLTEGQHQH